MARSSRLSPRRDRGQILPIAVIAILVVIGLIVVAALTLRDQTTTLSSVDCGIPDCGEPQGPEGMIMFAVLTVLAVLMAVAEARRR